MVFFYTVQLNHNTKEAFISPATIALTLHCRTCLGRAPERRAAVGQVQELQEIYLFTTSLFTAHFLFLASVVFQCIVIFPVTFHLCITVCLLPYYSLHASFSLPVWFFGSFHTGKERKHVNFVDYVWGVNTIDNIYRCAKPCTGSNWVQVEEHLKQIDAGDEEVWGVNSKDHIYKRPVDGSDYWKLIPGLLKHVSASGNGYIWGVKLMQGMRRSGG